MIDTFWPNMKASFLRRSLRTWVPTRLVKMGWPDGVRWIEVHIERWMEAAQQWTSLTLEMNWGRDPLGIELFHQGLVPPPLVWVLSRSLRSFILVNGSGVHGDLQWVNFRGRFQGSHISASTNLALIGFVMFNLLPQDWKDSLDSSWHEWNTCQTSTAWRIG